MQPIKIEFNRAKILLLLAVSIGFTLLCYQFIVHPNQWLSYRYRNSSFIVIAGFLGFVFFSIGSLFMTYILIKRKTAIIIDEKGITDFSNIYSIGLIKWDDIKSIKSVKIHSKQYISIQVKNNNKYLALSKNPFQRMLLKINIKYYHTPFFISHGFLECNFEELSKNIVNSFEKKNTNTNIKHF